MSVTLALGAVAAGTQEPRIVVAVLLGTAAMLAAVSFKDDLKPLPALVRFGFHGLAACAILFALGGTASGIDEVLDWMGPAGPWIGLILSAVWITGYTNAFNFMDGINGIAAGQAAVTGTGMALLGGLALGDFAAPPVCLSIVIAGAAAGFLPHNFPHARMFMGDVGSVPLGFLLASLTLWLAKVGGSELVLPLVLLHANFVLDAGITLVRRILRGERFHQPHREHFYQRLVRSGKSHSFVTAMELLLQGLVVAILFVFMQSGATQKWYIAAAVVSLWLVFFGYAEACFRRAQRAAVQ